MLILVYCWFINQITTWKGKAAGGERDHSAQLLWQPTAAVYEALEMYNMLYKIHVLKALGWGGGGEVYGCVSYCSYTALSVGHLEIGPIRCRVCGLRITDSSQQQRGKE